MFHHDYSYNSAPKPLHAPSNNSNDLQPSLTSNGQLGFDVVFHQVPSGND